MTFSRLFASLLLLAMPAASAWAQETPAAQPEAPKAIEAAETPADANTEADEFFFETVDVSVVNVDVHVTDKKGNLITGLTREDFEILEDKRPVQITNFYVVEDGRPLFPLEVEAPEPEEPEVPGMPRPDLPLIPEDQKLYLTVYVDNFNIRPFNRNRVFRDLRTFLREQLTPQDQVMLVSYDRSLKIRHPFTNDAGIISRALFELEGVSGHAVSKDSDRRDVLREIEDAESAGEVEWRVRQYAESLYNDVSFTLSALKEFVGSLAGLDGRKAIVYVSDGLEMIQGEDLYTALNHKFREEVSMTRMRDHDVHRDFQRLTQLANENRVSFYTIDAAGLRVSSTSSADTTGLTTPGMSSFVDSVYTSNLQSTLQFMAEETGGKAIINTNRWDGSLAKIAAGFKTYYSLGYTPSHYGDGRYHKISVRLKDKSKSKGLRIRHRSGYRDKDLTTRMADKTSSTLMYGFERNPLDVALRVGQGSREASGNFLVPIAVMVPIGELSLVPRTEFHQGKIKVFFTAMDEDGRTSDLQEVPLDIRIPVDEISIAVEKAYVYTVSLQMRGGSHRLAVGVRDEIGATESFVSRTVSVGSG